MSSADETKGRVEQAAGDLTDNPDLKHEGKVDEIAGKTKNLVDKAADAAKDLFDRNKN